MQILKPKILIITSHTGGGHKNLALALKDTLGARYIIEIADPHPRIVHRYYTIVSRHFLKVWQWGYSYSDNANNATTLHKIVTALTWKKLAHFIRQTSPQLVISTHGLLSYEIAQAIKRLGQSIPLAFQLTDTERVHATWFSERNADAYFVPTREIFNQAIKNGIEESRLHLTGRPIRKQFTLDYSGNKEEALTSLSLGTNTFTIFLQGGAEGAAGIEQTVRNILSVDVNIQIILAIGTNKRLANAFSRLNNISILPFTEIIAPYMAASNLIVGKAGASFLFEAIALEKPLIVTTFIPGQEEPNLEFVKRHNLGWISLDLPAQKHLLETLVNEPELIKQKISSLRSYKQWNSQANNGLHAIVDRLIQGGTKRI